MKNNTFIPPELVNLIADYHDYEKYCKPNHKKKWKVVLCDIISMGEIMKPTIIPRIARECFGVYKPFWFDGSQEEWSALLLLK